MLSVEENKGPFMLGVGISLAALKKEEFLLGHDLEKAIAHNRGRILVITQNSFTRYLLSAISNLAEQYSTITIGICFR